MELIDKAVVAAEIEKLDNYWHLSKDAGGQAFIESLLSFLDTLEMKEVDLVEEFADFLEKENAYVDDNNVISYYNGSSFNHACDIYPIAKHFYELGLSQKCE